MPLWADPQINANSDMPMAFNTLDTSMEPPVDRISYLGAYKVVDGVPRNPTGRTGLAGRGLLGRWGPNHAADPIVTR
jgi:hypothetical protein